MNNLFKNKSLLLTGGTGSFGKQFTEDILKRFSPKKLVIYSRDEMKQWNMQLENLKNKKIVFCIGDVRDRERLSRALEGIDYVVHAAATKIVPTAEYNPSETVKTNILGAINLIDAAIERKVKKVVALSTDKASSPTNLYGASKLASDKLFVAANLNQNKTLFSVVRYGNVMGSRGSIIPFFLSLKKNDPIPITDMDMTRFMISLEDAVHLVHTAFDDMHGGEIYVKKIPSIKIIDIAKAINAKAKIKVIGVRPGEKIHEQMIGTEDAPYTFEYGNYFKILPPINNWNRDKKRIKNGKIVVKNFSYRSDNNKDWMKISDLRSWVKKYKSKKKTD